MLFLPDLWMNFMLILEEVMEVTSLMFSKPLKETTAKIHMDLDGCSLLGEDLTEMVQP